MDKWIEKWEAQLAEHQKQYDTMKAEIEELLDKVDDIERDQWYLVGRMDEIRRKIVNRQRKPAF